MEQIGKEVARLKNEKIAHDEIKANLTEC